MSHLASISVRRVPTLFLLGLLALLLWGQCGLSLYPRRDITRPPLGCTVFSTDSLRTASPAMLYLTLSLHNELTQPVVMQKITGSVQVDGHSYSFAATAALPALPLGNDTSTKQAVALPLRIRADSLVLVRKRLKIGSLTANSLRLRLGIYYSTKPDPQDMLDRYSPYYLYLPPLSPRP